VAKSPDRLFIEPEDRHRYRKLQDEAFFAGLTNKDLFLLAMAVGYRHDRAKSLTRREGFFLAKDLKTEDEAILNAVALSISGTEVLNELSEVYRLAEELAHGGLVLLSSEIDDTALGSFEKKLELDVHEMLNELESELDESSASSPG